jgi:hypothetical protein
MMPFLLPCAPVTGRLLQVYINEVATSSIKGIFIQPQRSLKLTTLFNPTIPYLFTQHRSIMAPTLVPTFTVRLSVDDSTMLNIPSPIAGSRPIRTIATCSSGTLKSHDGELSAALVGPAGDWIRFDPTTQTAFLEFRGQCKTAEGQAWYLQAHGVMKMDEKVMRFLGGDVGVKNEEIEPAMERVVFETSDEEWKWVEHVSSSEHRCRDF